ncbi:MAG: polymer-forming cytoskeletal protein [Elusimicrobia bacterium]|nr:polymer-forming cytoskeletal protein [Elusimicrobiota bacterium]
MNFDRSARGACLAALALAASAALPAPSWARHRTSFNVEARNTRQGDVLVPKGETLRENLAATGAIVVDGVVDGDCVSLGGAVTINGEVRGDVAALGGPADVSGTVNGDLAVMGGPLHISGTVRGDAADMGGDVTLDPKAEVDGDLSLLGGKLHKADGAVIKGTVSLTDLGLAKTLMPLASSLRYAPKLAERLSPFKRVLEFVMFLIFAAGMGLMTVLLTVFLPKQVEATAALMKADFWKTAGVGALVVMLTFPGLLLMVVSVLGIPLIPVAILVYCAAIVMSMAACGLVLTGRFCEVRQMPAPPTLAGAALGYGLLVGLMVVGKFLQIFGSAGVLLGGIFVVANLVVLSCGVVVGLGAIWLTRMGTKPRTPAAALAPAAPVPHP